MFFLSDFTVDQCRKLANKYEIYIIEDGRMNLAALNGQNINYVAKVFVEVKREGK